MVLIDMKGQQGDLDTEARKHLEHIPYCVSVFIAVVLVPIVVISNGVVIATTYILPHLHKPADHIIAALAILDLLVGLFTLPMFVLKNIPETWHILRENKALCLTSWFVQDFTLLGSLHFLFLLCAERFICINFPLYYRHHVTPRKIHFFILLFYVLEIVKSLTTYLVLYKYDESEVNLAKRCSRSNTPYTFYSCVEPIMMLSFLTVSTLMTLQIWIIMLRHRIKIRSLASTCSGQTKSSIPIARSGRQFKMVLILMLIFVPMWMPSVCIEILFTDYTDREYSQLFRLISTMLVLTNSAMNVFAYALPKKTYRVAYFHVLTTPPWKWHEMADAVRRAIASSIIGPQFMLSSTIGRKQLEFKYFYGFKEHPPSYRSASSTDQPMESPLKTPSHSGTSTDVVARRSIFIRRSQKIKWHLNAH